MTELILRESVAEAPVKAGNRWRVIVARPGKGSSGVYSAEVLKRDAAKIVPEGAQSFITHDDKRDPRDMVGVYPSAAYWSEEDQAVVAELEVFDHWKAFVEQVGPHSGISLYALGEQDEDGNVLGFIEDAYNGADMVSRPGLKGSGFDQKLYEAARSASDKPSAESSAQGTTGKDNKMDEKVIAEMVSKAVADAVAPLVSALNTKAEEAAQKVADESAVTEALEAFEAAVKVIDGADLLESQKNAAMAEAKAGRDVAPLVEQFKAMNKEAEEKFSAGRVTEDAQGRVISGAAETSTFGAWK